MARPSRAAAITAKNKNSKVQTTSTTTQTKNGQNHDTGMMEVEEDDDDDENDKDWEDFEDGEECDVIEGSLEALGLTQEIIEQKKAELEMRVEKYRQEFQERNDKYKTLVQQYEDIQKELQEIRNMTSHAEYNSLRPYNIKNVDEEDEMDVPSNPMIQELYNSSVLEMYNGIKENKIVGINAGPVEGYKVSLLIKLRKTRRAFEKMEDQMLEAEQELSSMERLIESLFPSPVVGDGDNGDEGN